MLRQVYNSESSDELPEGDEEYKPSSKKKRQRKKKTDSTNNKDDDEIAVLEEKIGPKTKMRLIQNKSTTKRKTSSVQDMMKRLAEFAKSANNIDAAGEESDDDSDLTCSVCMSSYWYSRELQEHMRTEHGMDKQQAGDKQESNQ